MLYLSDEEKGKLRIPTDELWRVVRFEEKEGGWISWLHEREWRCKDALKLPNSVPSVLVRNPLEARKLAKVLERDPEFKCRPLSIIPLSVVSQGLLKRDAKS